MKTLRGRNSKRKDTKKDIEKNIQRKKYWERYSTKKILKKCQTSLPKKNMELFIEPICQGFDSQFYKIW